MWNVSLFTSLQLDQTLGSHAVEIYVCECVECAENCLVITKEVFMMSIDVFSVNFMLHRVRTTLLERKVLNSPVFMTTLFIVVIYSDVISTLLKR